MHKSLSITGETLSILPSIYAGNRGNFCPMREQLSKNVRGSFANECRGGGSLGHPSNRSPLKFVISHSLPTTCYKISYDACA